MLGRDRGLPGHGGGVANDVIFRPVVADGKSMVPSRAAATVPGRDDLPVIIKSWLF